MGLAYGFRPLESDALEWPRMADRLRLALVFHQHQPAGNPPTAYQEVTERAYAPLVAALYRHPEVKATMHFSGPLLDWLEGNRPDVIGDLGDLLKRGQVELLTAGYYEPILVGVPIESGHERRVRALGHFLVDGGGIPRWLVLVEDQCQTQTVGHSGLF